MDIDNFNKNVLRYNQRHACKRLGNIKKRSNSLEVFKVTFKESNQIIELLIQILIMLFL